MRKVCIPTIQKQHTCKEKFLKPLLGAGDLLGKRILHRYYVITLSLYIRRTSEYVKQTEHEMGMNDYLVK